MALIEGRGDARDGGGRDDAQGNGDDWRDQSLPQLHTPTQITTCIYIDSKQTAHGEWVVPEWKRSKLTAIEPRDRCQPSHWLLPADRYAYAHAKATIINTPALEQTSFSDTSY